MDFLRHHMEKGLTIMQWADKLRTELNITAKANCALTTEQGYKAYSMG